MKLFVLAWELLAREDDLRTTALGMQIDGDQRVDASIRMRCRAIHASACSSRFGTNRHVWIRPAIVLDTSPDCSTV